MLREDLRLPDVSGYVKEAQSHRAIAADGLRQTRKAVEARRPINECGTYVNPRRAGRAEGRVAGPGLRQAPHRREVGEGRTIIGNAQLKTPQAAQDARTDAGRGRATPASL